MCAPIVAPHMRAAADKSDAERKLCLGIGLFHLEQIHHPPNCVANFRGVACLP